MKSAAYVSSAREVLQLKFIDDFVCKASLAGKKDIAESMIILKIAHLNIKIQKGGAIADSASGA